MTKQFLIGLMPGISFYGWRSLLVLPNGKIAKQQKCQTVKLPNGKSAKQQKCQTAKAPNGKSAKWQNHQTAKLPNLTLVKIVYFASILSSIIWQLILEALNWRPVGGSLARSKAVSPLRLFMLASAPFRTRSLTTSGCPCRFLNQVTLKQAYFAKLSREKTYC